MLLEPGVGQDDDDYDTHDNDTRARRAPHISSHGQPRQDLGLWQEHHVGVPQCRSPAVPCPHADSALRSASFTPWAARTQQYVKEQVGQAEDKTQLPPDYIELEKRVDALKKVHTTLLQVTSQYSNEAYDYPANLRESFNDLGRTVSEKVTLLSSATSPAEAQAALTAPPSAKPQPKTFSHAVARASLNASHLLTAEQTGTSEDPLATALEKFAIASEKVGEARLAQDAQIQSRFLAGWSTTLNTNIQFATRARRAVENARLGLDATKANAKGGAFTLPGQVGRRDGVEEDMTEEARAKIEHAEDEFVGQTEEAVGVMKNVRCFLAHPLMVDSCGLKR